jgi:hypothetical protein
MARVRARRSQPRRPRFDDEKSAKLASTKWPARNFDLRPRGKSNELTRATDRGAE